MLCGCSDEMRVTDCTSKGGLHTSQTYLRFPTQFQPAADWVVCQAEVVCAKSLSLGSCAKVVSIIMLQIFLFFLYFTEEKVSETRVHVKRKIHIYVIIN